MPILDVMMGIIYSQIGKPLPDSEITLQLKAFQCNSLTAVKKHGDTLADIYAYCHQHLCNTLNCVCIMPTTTAVWFHRMHMTCSQGHAMWSAW